jgi:hypothetical protein
MIPKIVFKKLKVAYGLIKDIKGYYIHICSSSDSFFEIVMTVIPLPPLLTILSKISVKGS